MTTFSVHCFRMYVIRKKKNFGGACALGRATPNIVQLNNILQIMKYEVKILNGKVYHMAKIRDIKQNEVFTTKPCAVDETPNDRSVWIRDYYEHSEKKYSCYKFYDICHEHFYKGDREVYIDFIF